LSCFDTYIFVESILLLIFETIPDKEIHGELLDGSKIAMDKEKWDYGNDYEL